MEQNRFIQRNKCSKKRYATNFSSSHSEVQCKEVSPIFKILPPFGLHIIKIDIISGQQPV